MSLSAWSMAGFTIIYEEGNDLYCNGNMRESTVKYECTPSSSKSTIEFNVRTKMPGFA